MKWLTRLRELHDYISRRGRDDMGALSASLALCGRIHSEGYAIMILNIVKIAPNQTT